jgi:hypothetical protein
MGLKKIKKYKKTKSNQINLSNLDHETRIIHVGSKSKQIIKLNSQSIQCWMMKLKKKTITKWHRKDPSQPRLALSVYVSVFKSYK